MVYNIVYLHFPDYNDVEHLFMSQLSISVSSVKCLFRSLEKSVQIFCVEILDDYCLVRSFSQVLHLPFIWSFEDNALVL